MVESATGPARPRRMHRRSRRRQLTGTLAALTVGILTACGTTPGAAPSPSATGATQASGSPASATPSSGSAASGSESSAPAGSGSPAGSAEPTDDQGGSTGDGQQDGTSGRRTCADLASSLSLQQQVGQLFMAGTSSEGLAEGEAARLSDLGVGSVVLLGNTTAGRAAVADVSESIRSSVDQPDRTRLLVAADQEGGQIQRLAGPGFASMPSAVQQAEMPDRRLRSRAADWGRQLDRAGVDANLAPVADVVPRGQESSNEPIGQLDRGYGPDPQRVAAKNRAFIDGMHDAGIATSSKHFPGLGLVRGNTDFSTDTVDNETTRRDEKLAGFRAGVGAGTDMVMMSSATYTKIDPDRPALYSETIIEKMLRGDLGFDKVIISDDLSGEALAQIPAEERALRFLRTGGDLAIVGDPAELEAMIESVRDRAADNTALQQAVLQASTRVLTMKAGYGLASCRS